jgi:hypothetical protein
LVILKANHLAAVVIRKSALLACKGLHTSNSFLHPLTNSEGRTSVLCYQGMPGAIAKSSGSCRTGPSEDLQNQSCFSELGREGVKARATEAHA